MKKALKLLFFIYLSLCFSEFAWSADKGKEHYVIGVEDLNYYPLFDFKSNRPTFTRDLFDEFAKQYGITITYRPLPIKRFSYWLLENDIDAKFPDNKRWNSIKNKSSDLDKITYSDTVLELVAGTITRTDGKIKDKSDIKIIGTMLGFHPTRWLDDIRQKKVSLYESPLTLTLIHQLIKGQLDGLDLDPSVVAHYSTQINGESRVGLNVNLSYEIYAYHLSTIRNPQLIAKFNEFLANNKKFVEGLKKKYNIFDVATLPPENLSKPANR